LLGKKKGMKKHIISILTLLVVTLIAAVPLFCETRESGHPSTFGYVLAILTAIAFILGVATEIHTMREEARKEAEERAKHLEQKQQLGRIETEMKASTRPLLPVAMFYTLRHTTTAQALEQAFVGIRGFKGIKSDLLKLVGTARLGGPLGYNSITLTAAESHSVLEGEDLMKRIQSHTGFGDSAIRQPVSTTVEFFFPTDGEVPSDPTLALKKTFTTGKPDEVKRLELFDNVLFQDSFVREWTAQTQVGQNWSVADLLGSRLRVRFELLGERGPVALHDLQLFFGPTSSMHGIHFPSEILSRAVFKPDESPLLTPENDLAKQFFAAYVLEFECVLSDVILAEHFVKVVSR